jgi:hypothetical protein
MSRSRRYAPICGLTCARSERWDKRMANRRLRRYNRELIRRTGSVEDAPQVLLREVSDVWDFAKDGWQRFDPALHPELMRK